MWDVDALTLGDEACPRLLNFAGFWRAGINHDAAARRGCGAVSQPGASLEGKTGRKRCALRADSCCRAVRAHLKDAKGHKLSGGAAPMMTTLLQYQMVTRDITRTMETTAKDPQVKRESEYYLKTIEDIKSIDEFLDNTRVFKFAMKAFGLEDMDYAKAFMRKALAEGIDSNTSFANKMTDKRYAEFVKTFNFERYGETATKFERVKQAVVDAYVRQTLEESSGNQNEAVRLALYFERKADSITGPYDILADRALAKVVYTSLGLSDSFAMADVDKQAAYLKQRLNMDDFQDPAKLDEFLRRFTIMWDIQNGSPAVNSVPNIILSGTNGTIGIGEDLLAQIQGLKLGGI
ncbi:DUF1217 domain-containing protein [Pannonibacter indicus]